MNLAARLAALRAKIHAEARTLLDTADQEKRDLSAAEKLQFEELMGQLEAVRGQQEALNERGSNAAQIEEAVRSIPGMVELPPAPDTSERSGQWINTTTGAPAALRAAQRFAEHPTVEAHRNASGEDPAVGQYGSLGEMVRALTTTGGQAIVPTIWSAQLIDLARAKSAVMRAGAAIVPMNAKTVNIGRLTGDPTAVFRAEGSQIAASDPTFDNVTLEAKTMSALVVGSLEWFQDAENADALVKAAIAAAMASRLDLVGLYGGITAGAGTINLPTPPNPRGILAALNATKPGNVLGGAANGTTPTGWAEILDLLYTVRDGNEEPNALIWSSKAGRQFAKAVDTTGQPLSMPTDVDQLARFTSNQVPSYTQGTMTGATDAFAGDFTQLLIGQRLGITLQVLTERYADEGKVGIVAHWRGDVQPARSGAFAVYRALKGAA